MRDNEATTQTLGDIHDQAVEAGADGIDAIKAALAPKTHYEPEVIDADDDDGTMPSNVQTLSEAVVGHRILSAEKGTIPGSWYGTTSGLILTLDDGRRVTLGDESDCCAYTDLESFLLHPELVDHVITGVGTTDGYTKWHIYADLGDVLELDVAWSCGNPFYYGYGFDIKVQEVA